MILVWIIFIWLIAMIIYYTWKWRKEKKENMVISKEGMKKYEGRHRK